MVYRYKKYDQTTKSGTTLSSCYTVYTKWLPRSIEKKTIKPSINAICLAHLLVSLGSPRAMETLSVLPDGLSKGKSESPAEKVRVRVPPPPQPSFFTVTVILKGSTEKTGCQGKLVLNLLWQKPLEDIT